MTKRTVRNWTHSEKVNALTPEGEVFFIRLIMTVDDYGVYPANPNLLLAAMFPHKIEIYTTKNIGEWMTECKNQGLILTYLVEKKLYVQIIDFGQTLRRPKHIYPVFDVKTNVRTSDGQVTDNGGGNVPEVEVEVEVEKEVEVEGTSRQDVIYGWFEKILLDQMLAESFCMVSRCELDEFFPAAQYFFIKNQATEHWENYNDFKKHFINWGNNWSAIKTKHNGIKQSTFKDATGFRPDNPFLKEFIENERRKQSSNMDVGS